MSALPNNDSPMNKVRDPVVRFSEEYAAVLSDCRVSEEHTKTDGWRRLYAQHRQSCRDIRADFAKRLRMLAQGSENGGLNEDEEKALKEIAKGSMELRTTEIAFQREVVDRVVSPVHACEKVINAARNEAERSERDAPLHNVGLVEMIRHEIAKVARPTWNDELGCVEFFAAVE